MFLKDEWSEGYQLASAMNFHFHQSKGIPLPTIITTVSENGVNLMGYFFYYSRVKLPNSLFLRTPYL